MKRRINGSAGLDWFDAKGRDIMLNKTISIFLISTVLLTAIAISPAQTPNISSDKNKPAQTSFNKIKIMVPDGESFRQESAIVTFREDSLEILHGKPARSVVFEYSKITDAEYSYSKSPRWKSGLGLGAAAILFPPLLLVAIPLGFTKHRRHWLMIRTEEKFAVLKLSKSNRKMIIPTFETRSGVTVEAVGEDK